MGARFDPRRHGLLAGVALAGLLIAVSLACSLGAGVTGRVEATPTASHALRPTFTPAPGLVAPSPGPSGPIRGQLPPGVTALPISTTTVLGNSDTSLVLIATPTAAAVPATTTSLPATQGPVASPPNVTPQPTPYVVVQAGTAAGRRGPGPAYEVLGDVVQGQQLMLLGRSADKAWWQVCCIANQPGWVAADLVTAQGPVAVAPIVPAPPTPTPIPTATRAPTPTITPTPLAPFDIARGPEFPIQRDDGTVVIWVEVYEDSYNPKPLAGYVLKVFRNDVDVSLPVQSHNRSSGFDNTGPQQGSFDYNLKFEMPGGAEANWQIYLARPDGSRVSQVSKFTTMGDSYRNLTVYIAYFLAR